MSILDDIFITMREAERPPIGLELGVSGKPAFYAAAGWVRTHGASEEKEELRQILALSRSHTAQFEGWSLILAAASARSAA